MNLFDWLILGHFVADWLLQSDWMAIGKRRHFFSTPGLIHYGLYTLVISTIVQASYPQADVFTTTLPVAAAVFFSHWLVDGSDFIRFWMRFARQREQLMVYIVIDQTIHLLVLGMVVAWLGSK